MPISRSSSSRLGAIKFIRGALGLILLGGVHFAAPAGLFAQQPSPSPEPVEVTINLGHGEEITITDQGGSEQNIVPTVTVTPNQAVAITLQFGSGKAGAPLMVGTYDGGQISGLDGMAFVPQDGAVPFNFQPGDGAGSYRILVLVGAEQHLLQFWVKAPGE